MLIIYKATYYSFVFAFFVRKNEVLNSCKQIFVLICYMIIFTSLFGTMIIFFMFFPVRSFAIFSS